MATYWPLLLLFFLTHKSNLVKSLLLQLKNQNYYQYQFLKCIAKGEQPSVITPEESRNVVDAVRKAERSAKENRIIEF